MMAAIGAALLLVTRTVEPRKVYGEVDWGLLVFFVGLFVIVGGAERAGLTASLLRPMQTGICTGFLSSCSSPPFSATS